MMYPNDFGNPFTFDLALPAENMFLFVSNISQSIAWVI